MEYVLGFSVLIVLVAWLIQVARGPYCPHHCPRKPKKIGLQAHELVLSRIEFLEDVRYRNSSEYEVIKEVTLMNEGLEAIGRFIGGKERTFPDLPYRDVHLVRIFFKDGVGNQIWVALSKKIGMFVGVQHPLVNIPDDHLVYQ